MPSCWYYLMCRNAGTTLGAVMLQMIGAAKGMAALHARSPPVLHRDVKSPNFLVRHAHPHAS